MKAFCKAAHLQSAFGVVKKVRATKYQHECDLKERLTNLQGAFVVRGWRADLKSVLICDDIVTSGVTIDELAKTLKQAGAVRVGAVAIAISKIVLKHGVAQEI